MELGWFKRNIWISFLVKVQIKAAFKVHWTWKRVKAFHNFLDYVRKFQNFQDFVRKIQNLRAFWNVSSCNLEFCILETLIALVEMLSSFIEFYKTLKYFGYAGTKLISFRIELTES